MKTTIARSSLLLAVLILSACSTSQLSTDLTIVSDACSAATIAVPVLEASGVLPTGIGNIILAYTGAVSTAASQSAAELLTKDPVSVMDTKIIGYFADVAVPALGPTVGSEVQALVNAIASAVQLFLSQINSPAAVKLAHSVEGSKPLNLSTGDRHALGSLQKKLAATSIKAKSIIKP
jgi:hypothetical protein